MSHSIRNLKNKIEEVENSEKIIDSILKLSKNNLDLYFTLSELKEKSILLESLPSYIHYLSLLKISMLSEDKVASKQILVKLSKVIRLSNIVKQVSSFDNMVKDVKKKSKGMKLNHEINKLSDISKQQKDIVVLTAKIFSNSLSTFVNKCS